MSLVAFQGAYAIRDGPRPPQRSRDVVSWLTIYLIVLLAIPTRLVIGPLGSAGAPSMLLGLLSFGVWSILLLARRRSDAVLRFYPIRWALFALIIVSLISYALAMSRPINGDEVSPADVAVLSLLSWAGTMLLATDGIRSRQRADDLVWRIVIAGGLMAALGLAQFLFEQPFVDLIRIPGLSEVASPSLFIRNGLIRPNGTATHPIEYGGILAIILPMALHVAFQHTARPFVLRWAPVMLIGAVIGISGSRSAYLCALVGVLICVFTWTPRLRRWVLSISVVGLVLVSLLWPRMTRIIVGLFSDPGEDPSITSRTDSFSVAWSFLIEHPLFGRGYGTFLPKYRIFDNQFLVQLVSVGLIGTAALVGLALVAMVEMRRVARTVEPADALRTRDLAGALSGSVAAGFVSMAFFDAFAFPMTMGMLFLVLGIVGALARLSRTAEPLWR